MLGSEQKIVRLPETKIQDVTIFLSIVRTEGTHHFVFTLDSLPMILFDSLNAMTEIAL